jgi:hypothetical protein
MPNWKKLITSGSNAVLNKVTASSDVLFEGGFQLEGQFNAGANIVPQTDNIGSVGTSALTFNDGRFTSFTVDNTLTSKSSLSAVDITASGLIEIPTYIEHKGDTNTKFGFGGADSFEVKTGGTKRLQVNNSGVTIIGSLDAEKEKQIIVTNGEVLKASEVTGYVPFANINQIDSDVQTGYWQYVAPVEGYVEKVIVSPHQSATAGSIGLTWKNQSGNLGTEVTGTINATAGVPTTFNFGSSYNFSGDDRLNLFIDRKSSAKSRGFGFTIILRLDFVS